MTIDQLKYFVELARYEHVGKAAVAAHISPSALSTAVTSLERELGCLLFVREGKRLSLADEGRKFLEAATRLLSDFRELSTSVLGKESAFTGNPRLGASHFLASHFLSPAWSTLQESHPDLQGEISSLASASVLQELASGALDFGLAFSPQAHPLLNQKVLHEGELVLAVRRGHPLSKLIGKALLRGLGEYPAVLHKARTGVDLCEAHPIFEKFEIQPKIILAFDSDDCAVRKVECSDAWTMVPDIVASDRGAKLSLLKLPKDWSAPYTVAALSLRSRAVPRMFLELCDVLEKRFQKR